MENMECRGSVSRIRECATDILSMEEDLMYNDSEECWELMRSDLQLKSTFLYCDLNRITSGALVDEHKKTLTQLANKFFYYMEELDGAVKSRDTSSTQIYYSDASAALREVVAAVMLVENERKIISKLCTTNV